MTTLHKYLHTFLRTSRM